MQPMTIPRTVPVIRPPSVVVAGGTPLSVISVFLVESGSLFAPGGTVVLAGEGVFPVLVALDGGPDSFEVSDVVAVVVVKVGLVVYAGVRKVKFTPRIPGGKLNLMISGWHSPLVGETAEVPFDSHGGQVHISCVPLAAKQLQYFVISQWCGK